ncbi:MAG TPA: methionyl-tRNA formyltransferase [Treponema sp.]|nr:methionyl-tRNA formyltransferase [Treponema sp.]
MLRVVFAGSPDCAVPALEAVALQHQIVAVLSNPPASMGRSRNLVPTPVAKAAAELKLAGHIAEDVPIITPEHITDEIRAQIAAVKPDAIACFAYGKIFGPKTLALFPRGAINLHPSLLPRWRGCAPVPAAILAQDKETGISIQQMVREMDAGDILAQKRYPLDGSETAGDLLDTLAHEGAPLLVEVLNRIEAGNLTRTPQNHDKATYCGMLCKDDGEIDWNTSAEEIAAKIRAFHPWPGAFTRARETVLLIHQAHPYETTEATNTPPGTVFDVDKKTGILVQTGNGVLALETLQWCAKKQLDWKSFLNGTRNFTGTVLGTTAQPETTP